MDKTVYNSFAGGFAGSLIRNEVIWVQKICIRNNGPVKNFEMEVEKFNLLIGEQATGKSTIAKSVYYFKTIKTKITDYLTQVYDSNSYHSVSQEYIWFDKAIKSELKNIFVKLFGYSWDLNPGFYMKYDYAEDVWIQVRLKYKDQNEQYISVSYSTKLLNSIKKLQLEIREMYHSNEGVIKTSLVLTNEERKRNHEMIARKVNEIFCDNKETYYIPAGRSLLTVMSNNRAILNNAGNLDLITEMFMMLIDNVRNSFGNGVRKAHLFYPVEKRQFDVKNIVDFIISLEKGEYFYNGGREFLKIEEDADHPISLNFASSGQQEILWLLNFMYVLMLREEDVFLIIEEPEAHIYPLLQKKVMEFIVLFTNMQDSGVLITTHSPYILTAANNLYYAGVLAEDGQDKEVYKVLNKNYIMKKGELSAYKLLTNHMQEEQHYIKLLDEDEKEIEAGLIDDVSSQINELYTALYGIELDKYSELIRN